MNSKIIKLFYFYKRGCFFYFNSLNSTLLRLYDLQKQNKNNENINNILNNPRPPIFWKDKTKYQILLQKWDKIRLFDVLNHMAKIEKKMKSQTDINPTVLIKNSLINVCTNSWSSFK